MRSLLTTTVSKSPELLYLAGRAAALASRPLYLLVCNHFFGNEVAVVVASAFIVSAILNALSAVDAHRPFYERRFGVPGGQPARAFSRYVFALAMLTGAGAAACVAYFAVAERSIWIGLAAAAFFATERLSDETLRFTLFDRDRGRWGLLALTRVIAQSAAIGALVLLGRWEAGGTFFIAALAFGNLVAFAGALPLSLGARCLRKPRTIRPHVRAAAKLIFASGTLWVLSLAAALGSYLDRVIVMLSNKHEVAIFTLAVTSMSVVQNAVEYFYFSQRRREFLEGSITLRATILSPHYWRIVLAALTLGTAATLVAVELYDYAPEFPVAIIVLVAIAQVTLATSAIAREIIYWRNQLAELLRAELAFLGIAATILATIYLVELNYVWLITAAVAALIVRFLLFARIRGETATPTLIRMTKEQPE